MKKYDFNKNMSTDSVIDRIKMFNNTCQYVEDMYGLEKRIAFSNLINISVVSDVTETDNCFIVNGYSDELISFSVTRENNITTTTESTQLKPHTIKIPKFVLECNTISSFVELVVDYLMTLDWDAINEDEL